MQERVVDEMFFVNARAIIERVHDGEPEIVIQRRNKPEETMPRFELPGGRIEPYEPFLKALCREVKEETGLDVTEVEGAETRIDTAGADPAFEVECLRPYAVYQTVRGPIDSVGCYFRCKAEGELTDQGDETAEVQWIRVSELRARFEQNPLQFTSVDRAGIKFYLTDTARRAVRS